MWYLLDSEITSHLIQSISGTFIVRVVARNLAGLGEPANKLIFLHGKYFFILCEAYEVRWDFVIAPEQQQSQPHKNLAASHTGEGPSFLSNKVPIGTVTNS